MRKILQIICLCLVSLFAKAQDQSQNQLFVGSAAVDYNDKLQMQIQVGNPIFSTVNTNANVRARIGFPYGVLYKSPTFVIDGFEVSKGYHTDKINIKWRIGSNKDQITEIIISRKELGGATAMQKIASVGKDVFEFNDTQVQGGVLYEYKIQAEGVSDTEILYTTYIKGIGFRNPTATVSGSVSFEGGSPVQDVIVFAEANGAENSSGSSLKLTDGYISIDNIEQEIPTNKLTLQAWVTKYGGVFKLVTEDGNVEFKTGKVDDDEIWLDYNLNGEWVNYIELKNSYPTGELDAFGNDIFKDISTLTATSFIHVSAVMEIGKYAKFYVNGREINQAYIDALPEASNNPQIIVYNPTDKQYNIDSTIEKVVLAEGNTGYLDEVRVWQRALSSEEIRRDYRRYIAGNETDLSIYLRMDEKEGTNVYDFSKKGFRQNKNDGIFVQNAANGVAFSSDTPTRKQLGVFGVTDANGSYTASSIAYSGTGESFVITPSLGVHAFEPASQTLFLGAEESIVNQLNFKDISSFKFNGRAVYNVQGVFQSEDVSGYSDIQDFGYNQYKVKNPDGSQIIINKGQYYYEGGSIDLSNGFYKDGFLKKYPVIGLEKANVYIDGNIVFTSDNQPVETDAGGNFTINVPIGNHKIEIKKEGHTFEYSGFFPATDTFEFFEDQIDPTWFIDTTRISLVGRVVGGKIESDKPVGFGLDGAFSYANNEGEQNQEMELVSSKNNIGVATIILKGDIETTTFDVSVNTNEVTGEYKATLIPYIYHIKQAGLTVPSNDDLINQILTSSETLNLSATPALDSIKHVTKDGTEIFSKPFHYKKSFRYNSSIALTLLEQEYETEIIVGGNTYDISELEVPLYAQNKKYNTTFEVSQNYINKDAVPHVITKEFYTEGTFNINNNLDSSDSGAFEPSTDGKTYIYSFTPGEANVSYADRFKSGITVEYIVPGSNALLISNSDDFKFEGIIKGGAKTGGTAFATYAPEFPDIILRDPPGSNSFASIEKGSTFTFTTESIDTNTNEQGSGLYVSLGPTFESSFGLGATVTLELNVIADVDQSMSKAVQNTKTNTTTNTYTFTKTISTSDDPNYVGADGDVYIGNSKNIFYGLFNNMFVTESPMTLTDGTPIDKIEVTAKDEDGIATKLYISTRLDRIIGEQPTETFFTYSQKYLVETLIPELEALAANFIPNPAKPLVTREALEKQANLWKRVIQQNERSKYDAKNNRNDYKEDVLNAVELFGPNRASLQELVSEEFFSNQSFDAGVGELTKSVTSATVLGYSHETSIEFSAEFKAQLGGLVNNVGDIGSITSSNGRIDNDTSTSESEITTTISYTLKDNDQYNALSVDIVNMFDGNGPVFITKGGSTSCPYEGETTSLYFNETGFDATVVGAGGEVLGDATNSVFKPEVKSDKTVLTNIPESEGALFTLLLKNKSETQSDLEYIIEVDALTLNGATTNVSSSGVNVYIPYNETVEFPFEVYKSSASSTFTYDNIRVYLKTPCDVINASDGFIDVSVEFKKSCSTVTVSAPEDNFIFNRAEGYSKDVNGNTTTNTLPITFTDFNTDFAGFRKIELQYRNASSANWKKFKTYYGTQDLLESANDNSGEVIVSSNSEYTYNWDIIGDKIPDGTYEFRAISYCTDEVINISPIVTGVINLKAPVLFGTPQPSDGILDVGEDISLRFNEAVFKRGATSIEVSGLSNQQDIDHSVSVFLDAGANQIELPNQILPKGSFTLQFWFKNETAAAGKLISQENGVNASLNGNDLTFSLGGKSVTAKGIDGSQYNFYSLVYQSGNDSQLLIFENGKPLESEALTENLDFNSNNSIFIGGNNVSGNIHDIRFWSKTFTPGQATVAKDKTLSGRELNLLGYWKLDEGHGKVGVDIAKSRNAVVNLDWDIKPKGTGYTFENDAYLSLENVGFVQPTEVEDITLSFWVKTATASVGTIFSNGRGNDNESEQSNGFRNKWAVNMESNGHLKLMAENISYNLTTQSVADGNWHHIALVVKRGGSLNAYVDALETASVSSINIGGISGNKIVIGARLFEDASSNETIDNYFTGNLDEIRLWNTARSFDQIKRDRYFEIEAASEGLMLYADFNQEDGNTTKGPRYNHLAVNNTVSSTFSILSGATQNYTQDSPPLKPKLQFTNIPISTVINGDEMIIQPDLTTEEWSLYEGQILNFTVTSMYDEHFNEQLSPISWSAYVNKQEIEWFTEDRTKEIVVEKNVNEDYSFTMDIVNKGGSNQPYTISGLPTWVTVANISGSVTPNATKQLVFTVDKELAMGIYNADIFLETASEFNDRLSLELRVLTPAPDWSVNAPDYSNSMNVIGKIKINDIFSRDSYTKIGAFVDDMPRGEAYLQYDTAFDSYFVYLTAYSNVTSGEEITFKIWDAINGKVLIAAIDGAVNTLFLQNEVLGSKSNPTIFSGAQFAEQTTALSKGWTWTSFFVEDARFNNIKAAFDGLALENDDQIKSNNSFTRFETDDWFGSLTALENTKMYKVKLANANSLRLIGNDVDEATINLTINQGWNWLAFPIHRNISLAEALTFYSPSDGDVIKDQYNFAIYDASSGWSGTLNYMQSNRGYMMKSGEAQTLNYPNSANASKSSNPPGQEHSAETIALFSKYNANMSIVAEVIADGEFDTVLVYDADNILRGTSPLITINDRRISFISVFSTTNDALRFKVSDGNTEVDVTDSFVFEHNKVLGSLKDPVILNLKSLSSENIFLNNVVLYPNPFSNSITINASLQAEKVTKIEIFNTIGALVNTISTNKDITIIDASKLAKGVYLIKLSASNGKFTIKKLVKK